MDIKSCLLVIWNDLFNKLVQNCPAANMEFLILMNVKYLPCNILRYIFFCIDNNTDFFFSFQFVTRQNVD